MSNPKPAHHLTTDPHGQQGIEVWCICGWRKAHPRRKVRDTAAAKHISKTIDHRETT
jgi:hypothetical protein